MLRFFAGLLAIPITFAVIGGGWFYYILTAPLTIQNEGWRAKPLCFAGLTALIVHARAPGLVDGRDCGCLVDEAKQVFGNERAVAIFDMLRRNTLARLNDRRHKPAGPDMVLFENLLGQQQIVRRCARKA